MSTSFHHQKVVAKINFLPPKIITGNIFEFRKISDLN